VAFRDDQRMTGGNGIGIEDSRSMAVFGDNSGWCEDAEGASRFNGTLHCEYLKSREGNAVSYGNFILDADTHIKP